jgi:hypothetical protein
MRMENENENFDQLRKLLALKKHEQPPPGYFNKLPGEVISRLRAERRSSSDPLAKLGTEAPWLVNFWQKLQGRPAFAGAFGVAVCALLLAGIFFMEKPARPDDSSRPSKASPLNLAGGAELGQPAPGGLPSDTNMPPVPSLFDLYTPGQTAPASFRGGQ